MKWDYLIIHTSKMDKGDWLTLGADEWEFVAIDKNELCYFKRPIAPKVGFSLEVQEDVQALIDIIEAAILRAAK